MNTLDELKNNKEFIDRVNSNVVFLQKKFEEILKYQDRSFANVDIDDSVNAVFQNALYIIDIIPLMASFVSVPQVVRGRANYNGEIFNNINQLSYNIECPERVAFGRFNQKSEPLFYASLPTESKNVDYVLSCALECCKEIVIGEQNYKYQDITIGGWIVKESFPVINFCFDDQHLIENPTLAIAVRKHLDGLKECFSKEAADFIKNFLYYFSNLSGTLANNDYHYFATTALFHAIRYYYSKGNEPKYGVIYPGAMSEKKGLNIVMTREAVNRFLKFDKVVMYRYCPVINGKVDCIAEPCSSIAYPNDKGEFLITNYRLPPQMKDIYC